LHIVDDFDVFRKVPIDIEDSFEAHLGKALCDVPAPDGSQQSYVDYYLKDLFEVSEKMNLAFEFVHASEKYRQGFFTKAIELALEHVDEIKNILHSISGHAVDEQWSPIQIYEDGYLKNRQFVSFNKSAKTVTFVDKTGAQQQTNYTQGNVKLNWRIDWPARWWLMKVDVEPFGRDHASKGGSYDTGEVIVKEIFDYQAPIPLPYNFINRAGHTKKMSKSAGDAITAGELVKVLPAEIIWFFMLRFSPQKQLIFDEGQTLIQLFDDFAALMAKPNKTTAEQQLLDICMYGISEVTISNIPFSHLVTSYQASLKNVSKTIGVIRRTEHADTANKQRKIIERELKYIDYWLKSWAPDDVKFSLLESINKADFSENQQFFLNSLASDISKAPVTAKGDWFHSKIYEYKDKIDMAPEELFITLYRVLIGQESGPRAGWFLSLIDRKWLIKRLMLET
jgi:lysyl-tRNA synthetase class 1